MFALGWHNATWIAAASGLAFVVGLIVPAWIIVALPADYLSGENSSADSGFPMRVLRNLLGGVLLVAGIVMLVTPGQGVLGILSGLMLLEFPGKRTVERRVAQRPRVLRLINQIRQRAGRPPMQTP